jgi:hypothetical protein
MDCNLEQENLKQDLFDKGEKSEIEASKQREEGGQTSRGRRRFLRQVGSVTAGSLFVGVTGTAQPVAGATVPVPSPGLALQPEDKDPSSVGGTVRADHAFEVRTRAAIQQRVQALENQIANGDEQRYSNRIANFSKGLPHNRLGEVDPVAYQQFLRAIQTGAMQDFEQIPMGGDALLKNPQAGLTYELAGRDPANVFMPPAPAFSSAEIVSEIVENYWMALTRDVPFAEYDTHPLTNAAALDLTRMIEFRGPRQTVSVTRGLVEGGDGAGGLQRSVTPYGWGENGEGTGPDPDNQFGWNTVGPQSASPVRQRPEAPVTTRVLFRGLTPGDLIGPYLSQFMWQDIPYGAQVISQRILPPIQGDDYLVRYEDWLFAQNSRGHVNLFNRYFGNRRLMRNGRDLAEWVHRDVLFQAYFNAALILLGMGAPVDVNNPYRDSRTQCGFGTFGDPHIQTMVCSVATLALRSVWHQKWFVHRRLRPEAFAGRIHNHFTRQATYPIHFQITNSGALSEVSRRFGTFLLPMAYPEGCPTHPAFGAGHATVAGACVTILKAWFDESWVIPNPVVASPDGSRLTPYEGPPLTVGGELNKLASNVAIGRNIAGVHWRSDATESLRLGEKIAIDYLADLRQGIHEPFKGFHLTRFDGTQVVV